MKIYKYLTSISKSLYIDKLDAYLVYKYHNAYHKTIKMKSSSYIDFEIENNVPNNVPKL